MQHKQGCVTIERQLSSYIRLRVRGCCLSKNQCSEITSALDATLDGISTYPVRIYQSTGGILIWHNNHDELMARLTLTFEALGLTLASDERLALEKAGGAQALERLRNALKPVLAAATHMVAAAKLVVSVAMSIAQPLVKPLVSTIDAVGPTRLQAAGAIVDAFGCKALSGFISAARWFAHLFRVFKDGRFNGQAFVNAVVDLVVQPIVVAALI